MTTYFVSNAGSNTAPYDTEAKAATTLGVIDALPWAATDIVKISSTHTETAGAAITYTPPTTPGLQILSVLFNGSGTGALTAGAAINVGAASAALTVGNGFAYIYGVTFTGGTNNNAACDVKFGSGTATAHLVGESCTLSCPSAQAGALLEIGPQSTAGISGAIKYELINPVFSNGSDKPYMLGLGAIRIDGLTLAGTAPTTVFSTVASLPKDVVVTGSDLSGLAWTNLVNVANGAPGSVTFRQCKLRSGYTVTTGSFPAPSQFEVVLIDCDSGDVHYNYVKANYMGTVSMSNSKYADASNGADNLSLLMASSANTKFQHPLVAPDISFFNSTLAAMTTTVPVAHNAVGGGTGGKLLNSEMWQETLAKVTSGFPIGTWNRADRVADILTAGADQDTDGTTSWTGSSIGTHDKLVSGSFTPAEVGPIVVVVKLAKPSVSVHVSPKISVGSKQWMGANGTFVNEAGSGGSPIGLVGAM